MLASFLKNRLKMKPVRTKNDREGQADKKQHQDQPTAATHTTATAKPNPALQPVKQAVQQKQLQQPRKTASSFVHFKLLICLFRITANSQSSMEYTEFFVIRCLMGRCCDCVFKKQVTIFQSELSLSYQKTGLS
jgi:hypothetical protein